MLTVKDWWRSKLLLEETGVERYGRGGVEGRNEVERSVMIKRGRYKWKERERQMGKGGMGGALGQT